MDKKLLLMLVGPIASGKGLVAEVARSLDFAVIGMGDLLRQRAGDGDLYIKRCIDEGVYVPTKVVFPILMNEIRKDFQSSKLCLDGFPRTRRQAENIFEELGRENFRFSVIQVSVADEIATLRAIKRARNDDKKKETIENRMEEYRRNADIMCSYLKKHTHSYHLVDNNWKPEFTQREVENIIKKEIDSL